jgi:hypothetical protein
MASQGFQWLPYGSCVYPAVSVVTWWFLYLADGSTGYLMVPVASLLSLCLSSDFSGYMVIPVKADGSSCYLMGPVSIRRFQWLHGGSRV